MTTTPSASPTPLAYKVISTDALGNPTTLIVFAPPQPNNPSGVLTLTSQHPMLHEINMLIKEDNLTDQSLKTIMEPLGAAIDRLSNVLNNKEATRILNTIAYGIPLNTADATHDKHTVTMLLELTNYCRENSGTLFGDTDLNEFIIDQITHVYDPENTEGRHNQIDNILKTTRRVANDPQHNSFVSTPVGVAPRVTVPFNIALSSVHNKSLINDVLNRESLSLIKYDSMNTTKDEITSHSQSNNEDDNTDDPVENIHHVINPSTNMIYPHITVS